MTKRAGANIQYSADFHNIETALKSQWTLFNELCGEMDSFVPKPRSEFLADETSAIENILAHNSGMTLEEAKNFLEPNFVLNSSYKSQFVSQFSHRFITIETVVILLSHALCESVINAILAIGLSINCTECLFAMLEKGDIKEKWRVGPKTFFNDYTLDKGNSIWNTLELLTSLRNNLVHYKISLSVDGSKVLAGTKVDYKPYHDRIKRLKRFFSLPYDLQDQAYYQLLDFHHIRVLFESNPIARDKAHQKCIRALGAKIEARKRLTEGDT